VTERISVQWDTQDQPVKAALEAHRDWVVNEVLASEFVKGEVADGATVDVDGHPVELSISRA
jgi:hypothetical protein